MILILGAMVAHGADGARLYGIYCASCHGAEGRGDGPAGKMLDPRPADFRAADFWGERDDARLRTVIVEGGAAVGRSPLMAGFQGRLDDDQVAAIVAFLRSWAPAAPPAPPETAEPDPG